MLQVKQIKLGNVELTSKELKQIKGGFVLQKETLIQHFLGGNSFGIYENENIQVAKPQVPSIFR